VLPEEGMTDPQVRAYLNMVCRDQWFLDRFGKVNFSIHINKRRKTRACCRHRGVLFELHFPELGGHNKRLLVLHELCHVFTYKQSHGPIFCSVLLQVVTHFMGVEAGKELRRQYAINGVSLV
jgi:putative metallohydrolase (TIGR04338 family)